MFHGEFMPPEEEERAQGRAIDYLRRLWPFFSPYLGRIVAAGLLLLVSSGLSLLGPVLLKRAIDVNLARGDLRGLAVTSLLYLAVQAGIFAATYFQLVWLAQVGERGAANLKRRLFEHILKLPMSFFDQNPSGRLISRVESDTEALKMLFTRTSVVLLQSGLMLVGMSVIMGITSWRLYLLVAMLLPPFVLAFYLFQKKVRPVYLEVRRRVADINNLVVEALRGLPVIQVFNQEGNFAARMDRLNRQKFTGELKASYLWYAVWFLVDFGELLGIGLVLAVGGSWALKGALTVGTLVLFISYISQLFAPLRAISDQINIMQRAFASAERALKILDQQPEPAGRITGPLGFNRAIEFERVWFAYEGEEYVLRDINLRIGRGEKVALVGETGGGKSSLIGLILKFYRPQQGKILFDGIDLQEIDNDSLRRLTGFVPQEVVLFPGTVLDNLRLFDQAVAPEQVIRAAERVRIDESIRRFAQGYDTPVTEAGANLSLGERQLLAFARALVRDPQILILDEATSAVDPHTEQLIQEGLRELLAGRTAIIIAHRLATIQLVDRIVVVHKGRIAEQGTHEELLRKDGIYARFFRLQFVEQEARTDG
ncbi:MAG: ABC transporter ATP-binding protein/permease [candidate division WOR-3 bacterium]|uniref:ABC transporter ATP-binding protein n=1 Tax=candidate division WOR-3 bacterium TaxID=2052148 RepID=A0A7C1SP97_UNCW3|nr:ABC transporter ATP-binding protein/permease [candidate division WOR-3 bacterium]